MTRELQGMRRPRPIRVAFLVQNDEHAQLTLDGIFADAYRRWGGRFSLIVPCIDGRVSPAYWPWLEAYDPDIVYSYVPWSDNSVLEVHERISPSIYQEHGTGRTERLDIFGFKPDFQFDILCSLSTVFRSARYRSSREGIPAQILNTWFTAKTSRFFTDNFGTYRTSFDSTIIPPDARAAVSLLTVISPDEMTDQRMVPQDLTDIPSELEAMRAFAERRASSLSVASILFAPKLEFRLSPLGQSFNLVVGNTFEDRVLFWNVRHYIPEWLDDDTACIRVDEEQLDDEAFLTVLKELINRRNFVNAGSGGQSQLTVRSVSIGAKKLESAIERLRSAKVGGAIHSEVISNLDVIVPSFNELSRLVEGGHGTVLSPQSNWERFTWIPPTAKLAALSPDHLSDAPPRQHFTKGSWITDFVFESEERGPRFANINVWELPKRWRIASAFHVEKTGSKSIHELSVSHRRSRGGRVSIFEKYDCYIESVKVPTPYESIQNALVVDGHGSSDRQEYGGIYPHSKVAWIAPSNEAGYFEGVIGMAGSAKRACQFLLHPFLQTAFAKLGGTPLTPANQIPSTLNRITKLPRTNKTFDLSDAHDKEALAEMILKAARSLKSPQDHIKYTDLKSDWAGYRRDYWDKQQQHPDPDPTVDWDQREDQSLDDCLIELRRREIIFQGHRWTCQRCHHRNWVDLTSMKSEFTCEVCRAAEFAPISIDWQFRANEFLIESLRDHSVLSLLWLLTIFFNKAKRSLIHVGPTCFWYETDQKDPDAEADLLVLIDGEALVCEVKSSWRSVRQKDISDLVAIAKRLRPDRAVLAVMDTGIKLKSQIDAAKAQLESEGIAFELINGRPSSDYPYLMFDDLED